MFTSFSFHDPKLIFFIAKREKARVGDQSDQRSAKELQHDEEEAGEEQPRQIRHFEPAVVALCALYSAKIGPRSRQSEIPKVGRRHDAVSILTEAAGGGD